MTQISLSMTDVTVIVVLRKTSNVQKIHLQNVSCTKTSQRLSLCTFKESSAKTKESCIFWLNLNNQVSQLSIGLKSWVSTSHRLLSMFLNLPSNTSFKEGSCWLRYLTVKICKPHISNLKFSSTQIPLFHNNLPSHQQKNWMVSMHLSSLKTHSYFPPVKF